MNEHEREYVKRKPNHNKPVSIESKKKKTVTLPVFDNSKQFDLYTEANKIVAETIQMLVKKHEDYGPKNISDAPGGPMMGLAVRLHDKVARLANLIPSNKKPNHESIKDTFEDILNYAIIGLLVLEDKWDK